MAKKKVKKSVKKKEEPVVEQPKSLFTIVDKGSQLVVTGPPGNIRVLGKDTVIYDVPVQS